MTWGLAWTGLAVVLAVPSVDFLTGRLGGKADAAAVLTSDIEPVKTASITPADPLPVKTVTTVKTKNGISIVPAGSKPPTADPVDNSSGNGKALPDYISGDKPTATETQVASIDPTPPTPFPAWARPKLAAPAAPTLTSPATTPEPALIVEDTTVTGSIAAPTGPVPPDPIVDDSANWDEETLRNYLERRGILEGDDRSTATVTERSTTYDPDGYYLADGPNAGRTTRETRRQRLERLFEESGEDPETFTLF
ncbi:MAG: hypothetical protein ABIY37_16170 [Devosia sp.]